MHGLYTIGYQKAEREALRAAAQELSAIVLDVRFQPQSRDATWRLGALQKAFGPAYEWCRPLGNVNYKSDGPVQFADPAAGFGRLAELLEHRPVILLCACFNLAVCHRELIAREAQTRWPALGVIHLSPGDLARYRPEEPSLFAEAGR